MKKAFTFLPGLRPDRQDFPSGDPSSALKRRKEQLRKAQRTHRQRKDQYFKNLESQLVCLRASEVRLTLQVQELRNQVEALQATPENYALTPFCVPHDRFKISESDEHATVLGSWDTESRTHVSSQMTSIENSSTPSSKIYNQETGFIDAHQLAPFFGPANPSNSSRVSHDKSRGLDMLGAGMEFVLALERPCLPHLESHIDKPNGHSLLASSVLIDPHNHHNHQCIPPSLGDNVSLSQNSTVIFARLLALSEELVFEDELSPTQAWCYILQKSWAHKLEESKLKQLKASLLKLVKCYGFGAVMRRDAFEAILYQVASDLN